MAPFTLKAQEETRKLEENRPDAQTQDAEIRGELNRVNENLQRTTRQRDAIARDGQRKEYMIHEKMPQFISEIRSRQKEFRHIPQGPIGDAYYNTDEFIYQQLRLFSVDSSNGFLF